MNFHDDYLPLINQLNYQIHSEYYTMPFPNNDFQTYLPAVRSLFVPQFPFQSNEIEETQHLSKSCELFSYSDYNYPNIGMSAHSTIRLAEQPTEESDTDLNSTPIESANSMQTFQLKNTVGTVDDILRIRKIIVPIVSTNTSKTKDECYEILMAECKDGARIASQTPESAKNVQLELRKMFTCLLEPNEGTNLASNRNIVKKQIIVSNPKKTPGRVQPSQKPKKGHRETAKK
ncbi:hypothetical protein LOD99_6675 [Oopsacas minuta]|uniref:Uncharacterized protein n=1 Tax=Oopsacas minuta TaxID=111878 RepID=A0AAV7JLN1_9METZ|nr:hypothetical protein LOD99_6675 [Oopsacas minuta]